VININHDLIEISRNKNDLIIKNSSQLTEKTEFRDFGTDSFDNNFDNNLNSKIKIEDKKRVN
jgi:hypothetical protein